MLKKYYRSGVQLEKIDKPNLKKYRHKISKEEIFNYYLSIEEE